MAKYLYGMKLRGFSIGCQPVNGLIDHKDGDALYYDYLVYDRKLSDAELNNYDLDYVGDEEYIIVYEMTEIIKGVYQKYGTINFRWFAEALFRAGYRKNEHYKT